MLNLDAAEIDNDYIDLLEIDGFRVVKDEKFKTAPQRGVNNFTEHWIAHMCQEYTDIEEDMADRTGALDADEIRQGACYYCKTKIPEGIVALWSMLEWESAAEILHDDEPVELYNASGVPI